MIVPAMGYLKSIRNQTAEPNMKISRASLTHPGMGNSALPERLGSPGTANVPHSSA